MFFMIGGMGGWLKCYFPNSLSPTMSVLAKFNAGEYEALYGNTRGINTHSSADEVKERFPGGEARYTSNQSYDTWRTVCANVTVLKRLQVPVSVEDDGVWYPSVPMPA